MGEQHPASLVLRDVALTRGIDATPRDLALWASGQPGPLGALGVEALGEGMAPNTRQASASWGPRRGAFGQECSGSRSRSHMWARSRVGSASQNRLAGASSCRSGRGVWRGSLSRTEATPKPCSLTTLGGSWSRSGSRSGPHR